MKQKGFTPVVIVGAVAVILAGFVVVACIRDKFPKSMADEFVSQLGSGCKERDVQFVYPPVKLEDIGYIYPMGRMGDAHVTPTDHVYISPKNPQEEADIYDVVSPADGEIVSIQGMPTQTVGDIKGVRPPEDNRIILRFSCRYYAILIHAHQLAPKISQKAGKIIPSRTKYVTIPVKAGEPIAKISGKFLDWSLNDMQAKLPGFITPSLYDSEPWKIHTVDPFSVYPADTKAKLSALSVRSVEPFSGKIDYDEPGKAVGNWFREGTNGFAARAAERFWDGHLSIAPDAVDTKKIVVSVGNWQGTSKQFVAHGSFDPKSVTTDTGPVKVELSEYGGYRQANGEYWSMDQIKTIKPLTLEIREQVDGTVLLQVLPGEKLKFERFPGKRATEVFGFTDSAQLFER